jgi:hypothetical protein
VTPEHSVQFTSGTPETVLDPIAPDLAAALDAARSLPPDRRREAVAAVAARDPRCMAAWADLAELSSDPIEQYAYARVGYHRGLDALRAAGWRGSGYVRWQHEPNRGFLRSINALREAAGAIGETDEEQRCALFLRQLDPEWRTEGA